jgi:tetratricopeptide (TPR) repeat protein
MGENITNNFYTKVTENVYKFNTIDNLDCQDIYIIYNNACQFKKDRNYFKAINLFKKCESIINDDTKDNLKYDLYINLALLITEINGNSEEISNYYDKAINIYTDRTEPYYYLALYCNKHKQFDKSYELLNKAKEISYELAVQKYKNVQITAYGKYLYDELAVSCYWLRKYDEAIKYLELIINDNDFGDKERLKTNLRLSKEEYDKQKNQFHEIC